MKKILLTFAVFAIAATLTSLTTKKLDEGMFPLSELKNIDIVKAGLKIKPQELYNPDGTSLIDAIVRVGGCTGSFLSNDGLIVTNHHCAFSFVQAISDVKNDYIKNGFLAQTREQEVPAKGLVCKITASYKDVSEAVLEGTQTLDAVNRLKKIAENVKAITENENTQHPTLQCEISEMFTGKTYVLFRYKLLKDVRLVYVPPVTIGAYGGELDNWVWPRHSGDFAFLRAYVAPDGSAAEYSEKNVAYKPVKYLNVNPKGTKENDFVFILGYPGRTYRHQPAGFYEYHENYYLSYISTLFDWQINQMEQLGKKDYALNIKYAARIKSLANTAKNFKGKLQGFKRANLSDTKRKEEKQLQQFIEGNASLNTKYGTVIPRIDALYTDIMKYANRNIWISQIYNVSPLVQTAATLANLKLAYQNLPNEAAKKDFLANQQANIKKEFGKSIGRYDVNLDQLTMVKMLSDAATFNKDNMLPSVKKLLKGSTSVDEIGKRVDELFSKSKLSRAAEVNALIDGDLNALLTYNDELVTFASELSDEMAIIEIENKTRNSELSQLMASLVEVKQLWKKQAFMPDANGTLRFTYGYVKGYSPNDGIYAKPFTTLKGVIEKSDTLEYQLLDAIKELYAAGDLGDYIDPALGDLPVNILYNLDTTGGNSGSPIMNAKGQLIGINFDRAFTATINDYAWNEAYSRSVGVDIRYVLWVLQKVAKANHVINEMTMAK
ncbi:MAG: S46 family peptidase [Bacteroidia bacterium]|nr:S46 family peptidase [Bacteroidia bacterium]MBP9688872.1 S46 family peptidase [Bacteroidia bacterium]